MTELQLMLVHSNSDSLPTARSDEFLPPCSRWTTIGGLVLLGTVGGLFALASVVKYNVTVKAPATVRPAGELRIVQSATEGTVRSISAEENKLIQQGDIIAQLDNSRFETQKSQLQGNVQQNQHQLAQIAAQLDAINSQQSAELNLMDRTVNSAQADLGRNQRDFSEQQVVAETGVKEAEAALELAREELNRYQQLGSTGAIAQLQIEEKEQAFKAAEARLERAQAALNPSAAPVQIAGERIAQERARGLATIASLDKERENLIQRQIEIRNQLNRDIKELQQLDVELNKAFIRAPTSGTILKLNLRNPGQVVSPGEVIAQIAPSNTSMIIKAYVNAQDISKVQLCQENQVEACTSGKVQLRFSAYPYPDYGTLQGAVRAIAPDAVTPQSSITSGNSSTSNNHSTNETSRAGAHYEVTIQLNRPYFVKAGREYAIQPGMEATADIISREDTVLKFVLRKARLLTDL